MELVSIFDMEDFTDGLFAVQYDDEVKDELVRLFDEWSSQEFLAIHYNNNRAVLRTGSSQRRIGDTFFDMIAHALANMQTEINSLVKKGSAISISRLDSLFKPLDNLTKSTLPENHPQLVLFAVRANEYMYVIAAGMIYYANAALKQPDYKRALDKLRQTEVFLKDSGIKINPDKFYYYAYSE